MLVASPRVVIIVSSSIMCHHHVALSIMCHHHMSRSCVTINHVSLSCVSIMPHHHFSSLCVIIMCHHHVSSSGVTIMPHHHVSSSCLIIMCHQQLTSNTKCEASHDHPKVRWKPSYMHSSNQHTRELISARKTSQKQQRPESPILILTWYASKYKVHKKKKTPPELHPLVYAYDYAGFVNMLSNS